MVEIERKFLVNTDIWTPLGDGKDIIQGYLSVDPERTVRIRISGKNAWITIKGKSLSFSRVEFEYKIPEKEAHHLLKLCKFTPISKTRYFEHYEGKLWEIDVFKNQNKGLVLAEIELKTETERIELPEWISSEVSGDKRYFNSWLVQHPFQTWK
jgi:adenylate cyclase